MSAMDEATNQELFTLLDKVCACEVSADVRKRLAELLRGQPERQLLALDYLDLHATLQRRWRGVGAESAADSTNAIFGWAIAEEERHALKGTASEEVRPILCPVPPFEEERDSLLQRLWQTWSQSLRHRIRRLNPTPYMPSMPMVLGVCTVLLLALLLLIPVPPDVAAPMPPQPKPIATLLEASGAVWKPSASQPTPDGMDHGVYKLQQGIAKLAFSSGAETTIEGPAQFELVAGNAMRLESGVLYAEVRGPDPDFTVVTKTAIVRDLGTAFGVAVDAHGSTETLVVSGRVALETRRAGAVQRVELAAATRARVAAETGDIAEVVKVVGERVYDRFPRDMVRRVWLAALICEPESGLLEDCYCGLRFDTGEKIDIDEPRSEGYSFDGPTGYLRTTDLEMIDGVFVPHQNRGVIVDGGGSSFDGFPAGGRSTWERLWVGRPFHDTAEAQAWYDAIGIGRHAITFHAPKGFTIDLERVRSAYDGLAVQRFRTRFIPRNAVWIVEPTPGRKLDFRVLIDGREVYTRRGLVHEADFQEVDVAVPAGARFMTIVTTTSDDSSNQDWVTLDQALFELADVKQVR